MSVQRALLTNGLIVVNNARSTNRWRMIRGDFGDTQFHFRQGREESGLHRGVFAHSIRFTACGCGHGVALLQAGRGRWAVPLALPPGFCGPARSGRSRRRS